MIITSDKHGVIRNEMNRYLGLLLKSDLHDIKLFAYLWKMHGCIFLINWEIVSLKALTITFFLNCNGKKIIVSSNTAKILVVSRKSYHHIETFF